MGWLLATLTTGWPGDRVTMTLRTYAADITGSYGAGGQSVCGEPL